MRLGERFPDGCRRGGALRVAEPAGADTVRDVVDDVVVLAAVRHTGRHVVELEIVAHLPGDVVVGAGSVATHAETADQRPVVIVQRYTTAEHVGPADALSHHEVVRGAVLGRVAAIGDVFVGRVGFLEPEQRSARLGGGIEIGGRKGEMRQAECVGGVRLLGLDNTTPRAPVGGAVPGDNTGGSQDI